MSPIFARLFLAAALTTLVAACSHTEPPPARPIPQQSLNIKRQPLPPRPTPQKEAPTKEELPLQLDAHRQKLLEQHDLALITYEEQDALYAELEVNERLSQNLRSHLSELREMVLQMQVFQGRMIEYHNRSKAQRERPRSKPTSHPPQSSQSLRAHHEYHRHLSRVADHHVELLKLHLQMGLLSKTQDHQEVSRRHDELARIHSQIARTCQELQHLMVQHYHLDPDDEELHDPLENTPEELNAPDLIETI